MSQGRGYRGVVLAAAGAVALLSGCASQGLAPMPTPTYSSTYLTPEHSALQHVSGETVPPCAIAPPDQSAKDDTRV